MPAEMTTEEPKHRNVRGLPESQQEWLRVLEINPDGILVVDGQGVFTFANEAVAAMLDLPREEIIGRQSTAPGWDLRNRDGEPLGPDFPFARVLRTDEPAFDVELVIDRPDGARVVVSMNVGALGDLATGLRGAIASVRDITARRRVEGHQRLLAEAGRLLASSLDYHRTLRSVAQLAVPDFADWCVVDIVEADGIRRVATAHRDPMKLALLSTLAARFPPDPSSNMPVAQVLRAGDVVFVQNVTADELRHIALDDEHARLLKELGTRSIVAVPLIARAQALGAVTFVRARRRFEPEDIPFATELSTHAGLAIDNARLYEQAQESSRAKSSFIGVMSHEFRTPLTTIVGYTELLSSEVGGPLTDRQRDQIERIRTSAWHLTQVIDQILTFSRAEAGRERVHREPVDLRQLAERVGSLFEPAVTAKGLELRTRLGDQPVLAHTDAQKVRQILFNLLSNAVKFTESGIVELRLTADTDRVDLEVEDTGIGIAPEHREKIFDSFWQVESGPTRAMPGTGLGLTITRRLTQLLGGEVEVQSALGVGSTFRVRLPLEAPKSGD
jgi:PAS domain S-box-containing protein